MSNEEEKKRLDALLEELKEDNEEEDEGDEDSDEEDDKKKKLENTNDSYVIEVEEKLRAVYDKFIHGVDSNASVILDTKTLDYGELFSYLGERITANMYENLGLNNKQADAAVNSQTVFPVELKTIEAGIKKVKYFTPGDVFADSPIPPEGMTPEEYEKFRLWKIGNRAMEKFYMDFL